MSKNIIKKLLILFIITTFIIPTPLAKAQVLDFANLYMEVSVPDDTITLTIDTPISDQKWKMIGIGSPTDEIKTMKNMGVHSIFYDPNTKTQVRLLSKQSKQSKDIFHLSDLNDEELSDFLQNLIKTDDELTNHNVEKYQQKENTFFRLYIETNQDDLYLKEIVYGTIVNGSLLSFHVFSENKSEIIDETYIRTLVDGVHFTKYFDKAQVKEQERISSIISTVSFVFFILILIIWILMFRKRRRKQEELAKLKAKKISEFYKSTKDNEGKKVNKTVLFLNRSQYNENVYNTFFLYNEVFSKIKKWILFAIFYIMMFFLLLVGNSGLIYYILFILIIPLFIYTKKITIQKLVNSEVKIFNNKSKSVEMKFAFYEDYLNMSGDQQNITYPYLQISQIKEYKNYIYLYTSTQKALYLNKDGFEQEYNDFLIFIKKKVDEVLKSTSQS